MKRHKPKRRPPWWWTENECDGCQWYHDQYGICCCAQSEQHGSTSHRCEHYERGDSDVVSNIETAQL